MYLSSNPALAPMAFAQAKGAHFAQNVPPATSDLEEEEEEGRHRPPVGIIILIVVLVLLVGVYAAGVYVFTSYYYPGTSVLGVDISLMDAEQAVGALEGTTDGYTLTVSAGDFSWTYTPEDTGSLIDAETIAAEILAANDPYLWPLRLYEYLNGQRTGDDALSSQDAALLAESYDTTTLTTALAEAVAAFNAGRSGTFDVASAYDAEADAFSVEHAKESALLDAEAVETAVLASLKQLESSLELDDSFYLSLIDGVTDEELQAACDAANELLGVDVTFTLEGTAAVTLDSAQLITWISFDENLVPTLDTEAMLAWATQVGEEDLNTVGAERTYTREDGKEITVSGGTYGWEVSVSDFVSAVQTAVEEKQTGEVALTVTTSADTYTTAGGRDWGAYIDVDLTEQHAYYYDADGNLLWDSGIVSANTTYGYSTPEGVYSIVTMTRNTTLRGTYDEETQTYAWESFVSYWMPFIGNLIGLHDATWQKDEYFEDPTAYLSHGSHGCVNLPYDAAAELYEMAYVGLVVVVHW